MIYLNTLPGPLQLSVFCLGRVPRLFGIIGTLILSLSLFSIPVRNDDRVIGGLSHGDKFINGFLHCLNALYLTG
jgi:hypothetical protein